jgi:hypothetical protein
MEIADGPPNAEHSSHSHTYTVFMKNITLSVDEKILATVRRRAAEQSSSVNALVRDYLSNLAAQDDRASRARARLRELSSQSKGRLGKKTWKRDDLHDR